MIKIYKYENETTRNTVSHTQRDVYIYSQNRIEKTLISIHRLTLNACLQTTTHRITLYIVCL